MDRLVLVVATYFIAIPVIVNIVVFATLNDARRSSFIRFTLISGVLAVLVASIAGKLYYDPRPFMRDGVVPLLRHASDNGFPSDHTLLASLLGFTLFKYARAAGAALLLVALAIGWARVFAGVHHTIDIIGSFACSGLACIIVYFICKIRSNVNHPASTKVK